MKLGLRDRLQAAARASYSNVSPLVHVEQATSGTPLHEAHCSLQEKMDFVNCLSFIFKLVPRTIVGM
jgi:hypothetical protein